MAMAVFPFSHSAPPWQTFLSLSDPLTYQPDDHFDMAQTTTTMMMACIPHKTRPAKTPSDPDPPGNPGNDPGKDDAGNNAGDDDAAAVACACSGGLACAYFRRLAAFWQLCCSCLCTACFSGAS